MKKHFDSDQNHFNPSPLKPVMNDVDSLIGELYGLSQDEIEYLQNYHAEYGRSGPENHQLDELEADD